MNSIRGKKKNVYESRKNLIARILYRDIIVIIVKIHEQIIALNPLLVMYNNAVRLNCLIVSYHRRIGFNEMNGRHVPGGTLNLRNKFFVYFAHGGILNYDIEKDTYEVRQ